MWDEGARIYDTPGVHNNFPFYSVLPNTVALKKSDF